MNALQTHATKLRSGEFSGKMLSAKLAYLTELVKTRLLSLKAGEKPKG